MQFTVEPADFLNILILVVLEGLLSGDNALVLAVLVQPLPEHQQRKALQYGLLGAFVLRVIATFLAVWLTKVTLVKLLGGLYLLHLVYKHFTSHPDEVGEPGDGSTPVKAAGTILGFSLFWSIVIKADLIDLVFAVDSILAALGVSKKTWVIMAGGLLGILMMRLLTVQVLELVKVYPKLIDGAYVVISWVGINLLLSYVHHEFPKVMPYEIPEWVSIAVVLLLFVGSLLYARADRQRSGLVKAADEAEELLHDLDQPLRPDPAPAEAVRTEESRS